MPNLIEAFASFNFAFGQDVIPCREGEGGREWEVGGADVGDSAEFSTLQYDPCTSRRGRALPSFLPAVPRLHMVTGQSHANGE